MTLKQFFQLAGGIAAGFFFYSLPILAIVRWPFAIVSVILGVALAFLPLEERPLERWIFAFFKAIYSPTIYSWKRGAANLKFFQDEPVGTSVEVSAEQAGALSGGSPLEKLEGAEKSFLSTISGMFSGTVAIPVTPTVRVEVEKPKMLIEERRAIPTATASTVAPVIMGNEFITTNKAQFSDDAAPPSPPESPNIAVGQVVDDQRKIVDGAIIEIKDISGRPVRALRSNKAGHFVIVTPLDTGQYEITTEKEGFAFTPVSFEAKGENIPPILVQGRRAPVSGDLNQES
ncbi:MAG: carboxypeptidase-like regulatory domain-containing protein [bacterium]|nr:carboxypeptidase-like regulatory domain-containing protein [bacterium]